MACAGPVPDESDDSTELDGTWGVDDQWIDPNILEAGHKEEREHMNRHGVFDAVDETQCTTTPAHLSLRVAKMKVSS